MRVSCSWKEKLAFEAVADGHEVSMDSKPPMGGDSAMTPKQLVLAGLCGCTAMDVVSLLKKYKQPVESFAIEADAKVADQGHPIVFSEVLLTFKVTGRLESARVAEAVELSQTKFCGVSAMLSRAVTIRYSVEVNGDPVASGQAKFS